MIKKCLVCGKEYNAKPSHGDRSKYCSVECRVIGVAKQSRGRIQKRTGEYLNCKMCGKVFYVFPSDMKRKNRKYCSMECRNNDPDFFINKRGANASAYNGGRMKLGGYVYILSREHPNKNKSNYVAEHRLVVEKAIGRYLKRTEYVHHRNGVKDDNSLDNLQLVTDEVHHGEVECPHCNNTFMIR